jgi:hypothetical protein
MTFQGMLERIFIASYLTAKPCHCSCKKILPFLRLQPNICIAAELQSVFGFLWVYSEFEYFSFILSYDGNETFFGRWWNLKAVEMQDIWGGTVLSRVLEGLLHKSEIQLHDAEVEACLYVKQITTKNVCISNFTIFKNKYLGLCTRLY